MKRTSVSFWLLIEWIQVRSASPALSSVRAWKSPSSRLALQFVPPVQIGPDLTTVGSTVCSAENVAPLSVDWRDPSTHGEPAGAVSGVACAAVLYTDTATFVPLAATHGYTE